MAGAVSPIAAAAAAAATTATAAAAAVAAVAAAAAAAASARNATPTALPLDPLADPTGNTYKNMFEHTTMNSGLYYVVLINIVVASIGVLVYRYVVLRQAPLLSPDELDLLKRYPPVRSLHSYTPQEAFVHGAPPMRWTGWPDFFAASNDDLARDAQVYLIFQRACIATAAVCAVVSGVVLIPSYWLGGALTANTPQDRAPVTLGKLLRSDRGVFERCTSHNLPVDSPLVLLQIPVLAIAAFCVVVLYTFVRAAAGEERSFCDWLQDPQSSSAATPAPTPPNASPLHGALPSPSNSRPPSYAISSPRLYHSPSWTLFARGLPEDIQSRDELLALLSAIYPGQIRSVELVCKGRMSEARLLRAHTFAVNRLSYLLAETDGELVDGPDHASAEPPRGSVKRMTPSAPRGLLQRLLRRFYGHKGVDRNELIAELEEEIKTLEADISSRTTMPVHDFLGCAFITVRSSDTALALTQDFPVPGPLDLLGSPTDSPASRRSPTFSPLNDDFPFLSWDMANRNSVYRYFYPYYLLERIAALRNSLLPRRRVETGESGESASGLPGVSACGRGYGISRSAAIARLRAMKAERAPKSGDIVWKNIGISFFERTCREILVQVFVFFFLILFTSPVAMLTALKLVFAEVALLSDVGNMLNGPPKPGGVVARAISAVARHLRPDTDGVSIDAVPYLDLADQGSAVNDLSQSLLSYLPKIITSNALLRSVLLAYFPVLMLAVVFAIVPSLLRGISDLEGYHTHSAKEMSVFRKTAFYYVMNAVVLPSLALNTASEFLEIIYKQSDGGAHVYNALPILQSLFSGDIAFFLCNYLVQLALTGSVFWLMRLPASFSMMVRQRMALTPLEVAESKCTSIFDFPRHYAYSVTVMSMCLLFGFMAPLIWGFALMYYVCKHAVDTYLIRYVHPKSHIDNRLPRVGLHFVLAWTCVSQLSLAIIYYLQGWMHAAIVTVVLCFLTLIACITVGARVGNRLLRIIPYFRDAAIRRLADYGWIFGSVAPVLADSGSASSSTTSLLDVGERDALLGDQRDFDAEIPSCSRVTTPETLRDTLLRDEESEQNADKAAAPCRSNREREARCGERHVHYGTYRN